MWDEPQRIVTVQDAPWEPKTLTQPVPWVSWEISIQEPSLDPVVHPSRGW